MRSCSLASSAPSDAVSGRATVSAGEEEGAEAREAGADVVVIAAMVAESVMESSSQTAGAGQGQ